LTFVKQCCELLSAVLQKKTNKQMKTLIISYSRSGNNHSLAEKIASEFSATHISLEEEQPRKFSAIAFDMLLNRAPRLHHKAFEPGNWDFIIFISPVWMGQLASPMRAILRQFKNKINRYAFISLSGGAKGPNPKLQPELEKRLGCPPEALHNLLIADLLPGEQEVTPEITENYKLKPEDLENLWKQIEHSFKTAVEIS
jgi:hypothetical protein